MSTKQQDTPITIETISVETLIPYANNSKKHDPAQVKNIARSISEFGFTNPVLIDNDNGIIAGHGRVLAAKDLGMDSVPCIRLRHLSDEQRRAYIIADNKLAEIGGSWDEKTLFAELERLNSEGFDLDSIGFDHKAMTELESLVESKGNEYTRKIEAPTYKPTGVKPAINELFDDAKCKELVQAIDASDLPDDEKAFLRAAATRHIVFNFENVAEYYSHASPKLQQVMEASALVIVDFDKAIEQGFVRLSQGVAELFKEEHCYEE